MEIGFLNSLYYPEMYRIIHFWLINDGYLLTFLFWLNLIKWNLRLEWNNPYFHRMSDRWKKIFWFGSWSFFVQVLTSKESMMEVIRIFWFDPVNHFKGEVSCGKLISWHFSPKFEVYYWYCSWLKITVDNWTREETNSCFFFVCADLAFD